MDDSGDANEFPAISYVESGDEAVGLLGAGFIAVLLRLRGYSGQEALTREVLQKKGALFASM